MFSIRRYQDTVSLLFYKHGLACSSYPFAYILGVIVAFLIVCYPLTNMPFPGNAPLEYSTHVEGYEVPPSQVDLETPEMSDSRVPRWYFGRPVSYVQQIVVKLAVRSSATIQEALRSSLETMFDLMEHVDAYRFQEGNETLSMTDLCLRVAEAVPGTGGFENLLPQYNCLFLSPARLWAQDKSKFLQDGDIIGTIFRKEKSSELSSALRDFLFGVPGVSEKYFVSLHDKPLLFAFTFALNSYNPRFIQALCNHLAELYPVQIDSSSLNVVGGDDSQSPLPSSSSSSPLQKVDHMVHIHYQNNNFFVEYTPLIFAYIVLCLYLYFSVRKIEMVKSKWGLALSAMITVVASLFMSLSLCVFVGLTPSLNGSEIFPYLVVIIGLENILVVTKSVVSTPVHLEVKLRIALGLQKEGWYIFKNLITELLILAIGFFTFVPAIQEFCLFAILGLGSDFFLQMFFFTTVLSIDIRRMELTDLQRPVVRHDSVRQESRAPSVISRPMSFYSATSVPSSPSFRDGSDDTFMLDSEAEKIPKRVRLMHVWARYRFLQRAIMVFVILWIAVAVWKTTIFDDDVASAAEVESQTFELPKLFRNLNNISSTLLSDSKAFIDSPFRSSLLHENLELWKQLPSNHWKNLFDIYNISLVGRYLTILPSIHLSIGHLDNKGASQSASSQFHQKFWKKLENYSSVSLWRNQTSISFIHKLVRYPRSNTDLVLTILLSAFSFALLFCCMFILYKCLCSRKYAKWRSSWSRRSNRYYSNQYHQRYYKQIRESTPLALIGHTQEVECVCIDGRLLVSSCLGGEVRVWDSETGECISLIDRHCRVKFRPEMAVHPKTSSSASLLSSNSPLDYLDDEFFSERKQQKPRNKNVDLSFTIPDLTETIDTDFRTRARLREVDSGTGSLGSSPSTGFDFTHFQSYFDEQKKFCEAQEKMREMRRRREEKQKLKEVRRDQTPSPEADDEFLAGSAIWCLAFKNNMAVLGCGSGDIEFWDIQSRVLLCCCCENKSGVTAMCIVGNRLVASRVDGSLDFYSLQQNTHHHWMQETSTFEVENILHCISTWSVKAHQATINCLETDGMRVLTASQDNTVKVHRIEDHACLFTLIGHTGCITTLLVDKVDGLVVSGSADSSLRLWEVKSGCCLHKLVGHQSTITCVAYNNHTKRLFSVAMDDRLCIWDSARGHLLHCVQMDAGCCNVVSLLNHQLILTGGLGCIHLWDVETCSVIRSLNLSDRLSSVFVRQLITADGGLVVTDYGTQLRLIRFNSVLEKRD